jgi:hypothetical protein
VHDIGLDTDGGMSQETDLLALHGESKDDWQELQQGLEVFFSYFALDEKSDDIKQGLRDELTISKSYGKEIFLCRAVEVKVGGKVSLVVDLVFQDFGYIGNESLGNGQV